MYFLIVHRGDVDRYVGAERIRALKVILEIKEDRVFLRRRSFGSDVGYCYKISCILYEHTCVSMVG